MTRSASPARVIATARKMRTALSSGGVRCDFDDEVGIECGRDALEQRDRRYDAPCLQAGQGGLGHGCPARQLGLGQAERLAALADRAADAEFPLSLGVALAVFVAAAAGAGKVFAGIVTGAHGCAADKWNRSSRTFPPRCRVYGSLRSAACSASSPTRRSTRPKSRSLKPDG